MKTYLIKTNSDEMWNKFKSACALRGHKIKDAIETAIWMYIRNTPQKDKK